MHVFSSRGFEEDRFRVPRDRAQVGPINVTVNFPEVPVWTNRDNLETVPRANPLRISWTGGTPDQLMVLVGSATNGIERGATAFVCSALGTAGAIDVPAHILSTLPPSLILEDGGLMLLTSQLLGSFEAAGIDSGVVLMTTVDYQPVVFE